MLNNITVSQLANVILERYSHQTEASSKSFAREICMETDSKFEPVLEAWMKGEKLPLIKEGEYSVKIIMDIQDTSDVLYALRLLNFYKKDPKEGEALIWKPNRALHPSARKGKG